MAAATLPHSLLALIHDAQRPRFYNWLFLRPGPESVLWLSQRPLLSLSIMMGNAYKHLQTEMRNTSAK